MNESCLTFIHVLSPLHAGTGQGVGVIDLPIAREKATNLPYLPGSTLKGTLRDECEGKPGNGNVKSIFGEGGDSTGSSGSAIFTDHRLLCLPVRSLFGTFAWVTSPYILERFKRDCENIGNTETLGVPNVENENCVVASGSRLRNNDNKVILEDLDLTSSESSDVADCADWANLLSKRIFPDNTAWHKFFCERLCVVSDDVMNFLAETATEVKARNVLSENKTSDNLWYEEALPTETILSGILATVSVNAKAEDVISTIRELCKKPIQLGGNMTVGRGLCRVIVDDEGGTINANT